MRKGELIGVSVICMLQDYKHEKAIIKKAAEKLEIELTDGKKMTCEYWDIEPFKKITETDIKEYIEWYNKKQKEWLEIAKFSKAYGVETPKRCVDVIYKEVKTYLNSPDREALASIFSGMSASYDKKNIREYFEVSLETLKSKLEWK